MADTTFNLACDGPGGGGDRIRWTLVEPNTELRARLDGDTPQIEAVVEGFSPHAVFGADKLVELRVIRSWGQGRPPASGDSLDQRAVAEAEKEARRWGRSRGLSM